MTEIENKKRKIDEVECEEWFVFVPARLTPPRLEADWPSLISDRTR